MAEHPDDDYRPLKTENREKRVGAIAACRKVGDIILSVENRCMAADGPVTPTTEEMTEDELREIWQQVEPYMEEVTDGG